MNEDEEVSTCGQCGETEDYCYCCSSCGAQECCCYCDGCSECRSNDEDDDGYERSGPIRCGSEGIGGCGMERRITHWSPVTETGYCTSCGESLANVEPLPEMAAA